LSVYEVSNKTMICR